MTEPVCYLLNSTALFPEQSPSGWKKLLLQLKRHARKASFHHSWCNLRQCKLVQAFRCTNKLQNVPSTRWDRQCKRFHIINSQPPGTQIQPVCKAVHAISSTHRFTARLTLTGQIKNNKRKRTRHHFSRWPQDSKLLTEFKCRFCGSINPMHTRCRNMICIRSWYCGKQ